MFEPATIRYIYYSTDLGALFESLATGMTNALRESADNSRETMIKGSIGNTVAVYSIEWPWLSLPLGLVVLAYIFVAFGRHESKMRSIPV